MAKETLNLENVNNVLNEYGAAIVEYYRTKLADKNINASNELSNSLKYIITFNGSQIELSISLLDYYKYIENGRKPGKFPPLKNIENWIKVKQIIPNVYNGKLPTIKQLAFLISRKIANNGIKPRPILAETINEINEIFEAKIENAVMKDLNLMADKISFKSEF